MLGSFWQEDTISVRTEGIRTGQDTSLLCTIDTVYFTRQDWTGEDDTLQNSTQYTIHKQQYTIHSTQYTIHKQQQM